MKRIYFLLLATLMAGMASAIDTKRPYLLGLPTDAVPATLYFDNLFAINPRDMTDQDIGNSYIYGLSGDYFFYVEKLPSNEDDLYNKINLWMYDCEKDQVVKIFSQEGKEYEDLFVLGVNWLVDKQSSFKDVVISDSKQKIGVQEFTGTPVIIVEAEIFTGFSHSPQVTLLINPSTKEVKTLENQRFVSVAHTLTNMLMTAEQEYAQDYFITTSTASRSEEQPLKETEEYIMFYKQYLIPTLHVYNARGELVKEITLPEDEVDMIR